MYGRPPSFSVAENGLGGLITTGAAGGLEVEGLWEWAPLSRMPPRECCLGGPPGISPGWVLGSFS